MKLGCRSPPKRHTERRSWACSRAVLSELHNGVQPAIADQRARPDACPDRWSVWRQQDGYSPHPALRSVPTPGRDRSGRVAAANAGTPWTRVQKPDTVGDLGFAPRCVRAAVDRDLPRGSDALGEMRAEPMLANNPLNRLGRMDGGAYGLAA